MISLTILVTCISSYVYIKQGLQKGDNTRITMDGGHSLILASTYNQTTIPPLFLPLKNNLLGIWPNMGIARYLRELSTSGLSFKVYRFGLVIVFLFCSCTGSLPRLEGLLQPMVLGGGVTWLEASTPKQNTLGLARFLMFLRSNSYINY